MSKNKLPNAYALYANKKALERQILGFINVKLKYRVRKQMGPLLIRLLLQIPKITTLLKKMVLKILLNGFIWN